MEELSWRESSIMFNMYSNIICILKKTKKLKQTVRAVAAS